ncbi:MAG: cytochrome P450 [Alphaproteobacteria bacterium]|nr:cytochrome P450 [Alphaproteobacteria bacterium]
MADQTRDQAIASPKTYADPEAYHRLFAELRRDDPVHWTEPEGFRPFWTVSRHADVAEIERQNDKFLNAPRLTLLSVRAEEVIGRAGPFRTLVNMDNPDHRAYRGMTQAWFMPPNLKKLEAPIDALAREYVERMVRLGGACDFVSEVAVWYPLRVIMTILGVPPEDEGFMLKLTQELFGANDPDLRRDGDPDIRRRVAADFFDYFRKIVVDRRQNPRDDVATVIANATINGQPIAEHEALSYYVIVATAGHDTTSSTTAGGLLALLRHPEEFAKLRRSPDLLSSAVDEMLRWESPVKHFFRTAAQDYELRGRKIRAGDNLMMCYWSANRDEEVFADPHSFRIDRSPNRHLAFGFGVHACLGQHLAKMEIRALFRELLARIDEIELAGEPAWSEANFVSGLKRLPLRYTVRAEAA